MTVFYKSVMISGHEPCLTTLPASLISWFTFLFRRPLINDLYELAQIVCEELENAGWVFNELFPKTGRASKDRLVGIILMPER